ncbi:type VI secretion system baseplate subunit TssK [Paraferrimonas sedimenticola]|uniref:Type VI secretion system-associated protein n=1 Tax=Paraferrimonas sedimenticola TaxID=375674 RepID=A0AA37W102_9GAMM|nr:type VI secretion system baseplate subunit TssK [Paraferrimonas sedimenticola]GLP96835.1 type VI secretion system-associated protein [Paraferrimonas sedimenticola]
MTGKVVWSDGMLLQSAHFQAENRYSEWYVDARVRPLLAYSWGYSHLKLNRDLLLTGQIGVLRASGVMPDGAPFSCSKAEGLPAPYRLEPDSRDLLIYLALPASTLDGAEIAPRDVDEPSKRYRAFLSDHKDVTPYSTESTELELAQLNPTLKPASELGSGWIGLPIAKVKSISSDGSVELYENWVPPTLSCGLSETTERWFTAPLGLIEQKRRGLAARHSHTAEQTEHRSLLLLQILSKARAILWHQQGLPTLHPESLFCFYAGLLGELTWLEPNAHQLEDIQYDHNEPALSFERVIQRLMKLLAQAENSSAIKLTVTKKDHGYWISTMEEIESVAGYQLIMAINSNLPDSTVKSTFAEQLKAAPIEKIRDLVQRQLLGLNISHIEASPASVPYQENRVYFEIDGKGALWDELLNSSALAFHLGQEWQSTVIELWAVGGEN